MRLSSSSSEANRSSGVIPMRPGSCGSQWNWTFIQNIGRNCRWNIEGSLGRYSQFDQTFGYHADGVSPETATLPAGWEERLVKVSNENTGGAIGWCLDPHDLAHAKLAAAREKDLAFVTELIRHKMVRPSRVEAAIAAAETSLRERLADAWKICRGRAAPGRGSE